MNSFDVEKDYYAVLGVESGASNRTIEIAYRQRAVEHHPDRGGSEEQMKGVNEAYAVLRHIQTREAYDAARTNSGGEPELPLTSASLVVDSAFAQLAGAIISVVAGLTFLFLVKSHWMWFLWPLIFLSGSIILIGVLMAHGAMRTAISSITFRGFPNRLTVLAEAVFWIGVLALGYGVYALLRWT
jgi:curved DNA-binding protein CbpA